MQKSKLAIKLEFNSEVHKLSEPPQTIENLFEYISKIFKEKLPHSAYTLRYKDADGDMITIQHEDDWKLAISTTEEEGQKFLRVMITAIGETASVTNPLINSAINTEYAQNNPLNDVSIPESQQKHTSVSLQKEDQSDFNGIDFFKVAMQPLQTKADQQTQCKADSKNVSNQASVLQSNAENQASVTQSNAEQQFSYKIPTQESGMQAIVEQINAETQSPTIKHQPSIQAFTQTVEPQKKTVNQEQRPDASSELKKQNEAAMDRKFQEFSQDLIAGLGKAFIGHRMDASEVRTQCERCEGFPKEVQSFCKACLGQGTQKVNPLSVALFETIFETKISQIFDIIQKQQQAGQPMGEQQQQQLQQQKISACELIVPEGLNIQEPVQVQVNNHLDNKDYENQLKIDDKKNKIQYEPNIFTSIEDPILFDLNKPEVQKNNNHIPVNQIFDQKLNYDITQDPFPKLQQQQKPEYKAKISTSPPEWQFFLKRGQRVDSTFIVENNGQEVWPQNVTISCVEGYNVGMWSAVVPLSTAERGQVKIPLQAPNQVGKFNSAWRLMYSIFGQEKYFGPKIVYEINVQDVKEQAKEGGAIICEPIDNTLNDPYLKNCSKLLLDNANQIKSILGVENVKTIVQFIKDRKLESEAVENVIAKWFEEHH